MEQINEYLRMIQSLDGIKSSNETSSTTLHRRLWTGTWRSWVSSWWIRWLSIPVYWGRC